MVFIIQVCWSQTLSKPVWHILFLCGEWKTPDDWQRNWPKHVAVSRILWHITLLCVQWKTPDDRQRNVLHGREPPPHPKELKVSRLFKKFTSYYGIWKYISASQQPVTCPHPKTDQSSSCIHLFSVPLILVLFFHLRLSLPGDICRSGLPNKLLNAPHLAPHTCYMPSLSNSSWFYDPNYLFWSHALCN